MYEFEVEGTIVGKQRPRVNMYTGNVYTPNKTKDYEEWIKQSFFIKYPKFDIITNRVKIEIIAYLKIPKSTSKKMAEKMLDDEISPLKKPDIDNIAKVVLDAINNYVIKDDIQVSKMRVEKKYSENEKLIIKIEEY